MRPGPRQDARAGRTAVAFLGATAIVAGCSGPGSVGLAPPRPTGSVARQCAALVAAVPHQVAGQDRRSISPATPYAAAWGDPPIVLRCGDGAPRALQPTSQCFVVNGVGWLVTQHGVEVDPTRPLSGDLSFTTIGRSAYVDVNVPGSYQPAADALVDLTGTVRSHTTEQRPCH